MASSSFRQISTLERLRAQHDENKAQLDHQTRQILSGASTLAIEMAEMQVTYINELEKELDRLRAKVISEEAKVARLEFEKNNLGAELLRKQFPQKGKRR